MRSYMDNCSCQEKLLDSWTATNSKESNHKMFFGCKQFYSKQFTAPQQGIFASNGTMELFK